MIKHKFVYKTTKPDIDKFWPLFLTSGWNDSYKFSKEDLDKSLESNWYSMSVYLSDELIGYGRIISDGIYHALVADLIILPEYQVKGIGSELLKILLKKCTDHKIRDIQLFSAKNKFKFYEKYGFARRPENAPGMEYKY